MEKLKVRTIRAGSPADYRLVEGWDFVPCPACKRKPEWRRVRWEISSRASDAYLSEQLARINERAILTRAGLRLRHDDRLA